MFFRGYVETKDKQCVEKFKGRTDFKTYEQVKSLPEFAGILAEDTILVDLDDGESSDVLFKVVQDYSLNCRVYRTTRGKHFLFKNSGVGGCKTHCTLAIGLKADIKVGVKSSYEVLKYGGVEREILYDTAENEQAQPLPRWLFPVRSKMAFLDMEEGDGRNQALFNYILTLQSNDFTVEEARETIRIINKYVLKVPLSDSEIETILRDDSFKKPVFYNGSTFLFDKFAIFLKNNAHIIKINNQLHIYKDGIYTAGYGEIEAAMIKHIPDLNRAKRSEVVDYLDLLIRDNTRPEDAHLIAFKNGLYNIIDAKLIFSANNIPRMKDPTGAAMRRLLTIPLNAKFSENDPDYDPQINVKLTQQEAMEYFILLAIGGLKRVLKNKHFTVSQKVQQAKTDYEQENNPILAFIEDCRNDNGDVEGIYNEATREVYIRYNEFCIKNNFRPVNRLTFSKQLNQALGTTVKNMRLNGKQCKVFVEQ